MEPTNSALERSFATSGHARLGLHCRSIESSSHQHPVWCIRSTYWTTRQGQSTFFPLKIKYLGYAHISVDTHVNVTYFRLIRFILIWLQLKFRWSCMHVDIYGAKWPISVWAPNCLLFQLLNAFVGRLKYKGLERQLTYLKTIDYTMESNGVCILYLRVSTLVSIHKLMLHFCYANILYLIRSYISWMGTAAW